MVLLSQLNAALDLDKNETHAIAVYTVPWSKLSAVISEQAGAKSENRWLQLGDDRNDSGVIRDCTHKRAWLGPGGLAKQAAAGQSQAAQISGTGAAALCLR